MMGVALWAVGGVNMSEKKRIEDLRAVWPERLARVRRSQARTDTTGMTRRPRDPDERESLAARG